MFKIVILIFCIFSINLNALSDFEKVIKSGEIIINGLGFLKK